MLVYRFMNIMLYPQPTLCCTWEILPFYVVLRYSFSCTLPPVRSSNGIASWKTFPPCQTNLPLISPPLLPHHFLCRRSGRQGVVTLLPGLCGGSCAWIPPTPIHWQWKEGGEGYPCGLPTHELVGQPLEKLSLAT